jgi:hypothetical protein
VSGHEGSVAGAQASNANLRRRPDAPRESRPRVAVVVSDGLDVVAVGVEHERS